MGVWSGVRTCASAGALILCVFASLALDGVHWTPVFADQGPYLYKNSASHPLVQSGAAHAIPRRADLSKVGFQPGINELPVHHTPLVEDHKKWALGFVQALVARQDDSSAGDNNDAVQGSDAGAQGADASPDAGAQGADASPDAGAQGADASSDPGGTGSQEPDALPGANNAATEDPNVDAQQSGASPGVDVIEEQGPGTSAQVSPTSTQAAGTDVQGSSPTSPVSASVASPTSPVSASVTSPTGSQAQSVTAPIVQLAASDLRINELVFGDKDFGTKYEHYSGHVPVGPGNTNTLFFWLMKASKPIGKKKLILWFNGGPGCSSMTGAMLEVGPFKFKHRSTTGYTFEDNAANITDHSTMLFVDHPPGVGLSILSKENIYPTTYDQWIDLFVEFMSKIMNLFPELKGSDIYFSGESFAGYYLPHMSRGLMKNIDKVDGVDIKDLKGIIVGNPWFDPVSHYKYYHKFLVDNEVLSEWGFNALLDVKNECDEALVKDYSSWDDMKNQNSVCGKYNQKLRVISREDLGGGLCINVYDIRLKDALCGMMWPDSADKMPGYFSNPEVVKNMHISVPQTVTKVFDECTSVNTSLQTIFDESQPGIVVSSELLTEHSDFKIVIFEGDADYICNVYGATEAIGRVRIGDAPEGMDKFEKFDWYIDNEKVGEYYKYKNLEYYIIYGGSHMTAVESPKPTYDVYLRSVGLADENSGSSMVEQSGGDDYYVGNTILIILLVVFSVSLVGMLVYALMHKGNKVVPPGTKETDYLINP